MGDNGTVHSGVPEKQLLLRYNKEETDLQSHTMHVFILYKLIFTMAEKILQILMCIKVDDQA